MPVVATKKAKIDKAPQYVTWKTNTPPDESPMLAAVGSVIQKPMKTTIWSSTQHMENIAQTTQKTNLTTKKSWNTITLLQQLLWRVEIECMRPSILALMTWMRL